MIDKCWNVPKARPKAISIGASIEDPEFRLSVNGDAFVCDYRSEQIARNADVAFQACIRCLASHFQNATAYRALLFDEVHSPCFTTQPLGNGCSSDTRTYNKDIFSILHISPNLSGFFWNVECDFDGSEQKGL
jgi:hypothetical protein